MCTPLLSPHMWGNPTYKNKIELSHPMRLTDESAASHGNDNSSISTTNIQKIFIQKILGIDKVVSTHGDSPALMVNQNSNVFPARTYLPPLLL